MEPEGSTADPCERPRRLVIEGLVSAGALAMTPVLGQALDGAQADRTHQ